MRIWIGIWWQDFSLHGSEFSKFSPHIFCPCCLTTNFRKKLCGAMGFQINSMSPMTFLINFQCLPSTLKGDWFHYYLPVDLPCSYWLQINYKEATCVVLPVYHWDCSWMNKTIVVCCDDTVDIIVTNTFW